MGQLFPVAEVALIPIVAIVCAVGLPMLIPIAAIFLHHQRKMAELMRMGMNTQTDQALAHVLAELQSMRSSMTDMQDRVNQLAISADTAPIRSSPPSFNAPDIASEEVKA